MKSRFALAAAAMTCLLAGAAIIGITQQKEAVNQIVDVYLGNTRLAIPSPYFRFDHAKLGGRLPEIDLAADSKTFRPVILKVKIPKRNQKPAENTLYLTVSNASETLGPGERTTRLYARFLEADVWSHPGGLIMRRFQDGSPYQNEDLYMTPPEGRRFSARCPRPRQPPDGLPDSCLADIRLDGIDVRLRFSSALLPDWEQLYNGTRGLVQSFRR